VDLGAHPVKRAEVDWAEVPYPVTVAGQSGGLEPSAEEPHGPHVFLYVPDYSAETRWSTHRVPERKPERAERRNMGFRR
jgi:hypothetical protein